MNLAEWGTVAGIVFAVFTIGSVFATALFRRLDHLDTCLDKVRVEVRDRSELDRATLLSHQETVRSELRQEQIRARDDLSREEQQTRTELRAYVVEDTHAHLRLERLVAWMTGKMGYELPEEWGQDDFPAPE